MKPNSLKPFFTFENRQVVVQDRVWCIPDYLQDYQTFSFEGFNSPAFFGNNQAVAMEICSGNGDWIVAKAIAEPHKNFIAVEKQFKRVKKIWSKMKNHDLSNLLIVCSDARILLKYFLKTSSIDEVHINFPDPWPKKKHAKHRLTQGDFFAQLHRVLVFGGTLALMTDDSNYMHEAVESFAQISGLDPVFPEPHFQLNPSDYGFSYFRQLWEEMGRQFYYYQAKKQKVLHQEMVHG